MVFNTDQYLSRDMGTQLWYTDRVVLAIWFYEMEDIKILRRTACKRFDSLAKDSQGAGLDSSYPAARGQRHLFFAGMGIGFPWVRYKGLWPA